MMKSTSPPPKPAFVRHLQTVREAREKVDLAVSALDQARSQANFAVTYIWEFLFDHMCEENRKKLSIPELNNLANTIQRVVQSIDKLSTLEAVARAEAIQYARTVLIKSGLPPELREQLEKDLNLMS